MSKHTPGPWEYDLEEGFRPEWAYTIHAEIGIGGTIAKVFFLPRRMEELGPQEIDANARLIAAAPDLLKACKDALDFVNGEPLGVNALEMILNAAIRKAEGES